LVSGALKELKRVDSANESCHLTVVIRDAIYSGGAAFSLWRSAVAPVGRRASVQNLRAVICLRTQRSQTIRGSLDRSKSNGGCGNSRPCFPQAISIHYRFATIR